MAVALGADADPGQCRPLGAFIFGRLADRFGRRPVLMSTLRSIRCSASPPPSRRISSASSSFARCSASRWAAMGHRRVAHMETVKPESARLRLRSPAIGLSDRLSARSSSIAISTPASAGAACSWSASFRALLISTSAATYRNRPAGRPNTRRRHGVRVLRRHWQLALYAIVLMTAFNFFSHGTQDIYPTFLQEQHHSTTPHDRHYRHHLQYRRDPRRLDIRHWSRVFGRRRTIIVAALLAIPVRYLWAYSENRVMLAVGAFLMQFFVQGAWGVIPAHLNELSPPMRAARSPAPSISSAISSPSYKLSLQTEDRARARGENYSLALAGVAVAAAVADRGAHLAGAAKRATSRMVAKAG